MKRKFIDAYMDVAYRFSKLSTARRLNVGAIIVKNDRIISIGYNGMPSGWDNNCEIEFSTSPWPAELPELLNITYTLKTKPEVIHAEANAIAKLAKSTESGENSVMFLTHSPCIECAKQIYTAGIKKVFYREQYRSTDGLDFLNKCGIEVEQT
jgi:dCMP deaminase